MLNIEKTYFRGHALPEVTPEDLSVVRARFASIGVLGGLIRSWDNGPLELLMLKHRPSAKVTTGQWGVLGELMQAAYLEGQPVCVESPQTTLERGIREELHPSEPASLEYLGYFFSERDIVPGGKRALAICPVINCGMGDWIPRFPDSPEVIEARFIPLEEVLGAEEQFLRPQTHNFVRGLKGFMTRRPLGRHMCMDFGDKKSVLEFEDLALG